MIFINGIRIRSSKIVKYGLFMPKGPEKLTEYPKLFMITMIALKLCFQTIKIHKTFSPKHFSPICFFDVFCREDKRAPSGILGQMHLCKIYWKHRGSVETTVLVLVRLKLDVDLIRTPLLDKIYNNKNAL